MPRECERRVGGSRLPGGVAKSLLSTDLGRQRARTPAAGWNKNMTPIYDRLAKTAPFCLYFCSRCGESTSLGGLRLRAVGVVEHVRLRRSPDGLLRACRAWGTSCGGRRTSPAGTPRITTGVCGARNVLLWISIDVPGDVRAVFAVAAAVHVEAVAQRHAQFHVVPRHVPAAGPARARDGVAIPVEQVALDQRRRHVVRHAVAQAVVLAVVDEVVVDVMPFAFRQADAGVAETGDVAVVDFETRRARSRCRLESGTCSSTRARPPPGPNARR